MLFRSERAVGLRRQKAAVDDLVGVNRAIVAGEDDVFLLATEIDVQHQLVCAVAVQVEKVAVSARLTDAPACITTEGPLSLEMEKVLQKGPEGAPDGMPKSQRVLELNAKHPVFDKLVAAQKAGDADKIKQYSGLLYDQALLVEGILPEDPVAFAAALCNLM